MKVEFYKHNIDEVDIKEVVDTLHSTFLSTGPKTRLFEEKFARYLGLPHVVGVTSCTAGLFLALKTIGLEPGDEVITSPMTFIATPNAILHAGGKPVFVDVEKKTGNINVELIEKAITPKTRVIIPVHLYGQMCDMRAIRKIADKYRLKIIEDCAHCIEGVRDQIRPGQLSDAAVFSFYATKNLTCGEGGAIAVHDMELAERLKVLRLHGMNKSAADRYTSKYQHWDMVELGYKFNMFDLQAALIVDQLERVETYRKRREEICRRYEEAFSNIAGLAYPIVLPHSDSARHLFTIWVSPLKRDFILAALQERGVGVAVNFRAVHLLKYYRETFGFREGDFPEAERIGNSTISIPLYCRLTDEEISHVVRSVVDVVR